ncbi:MAG TPA: hypothetical protein PK402_08120 [Tepidisphaeraceae bacterium]|nr:hypothetical protein [Tepidisphaeraceae bacterium]
MDFLKSIGGKIVTGLIALLVIGAAIAWFQAAPETRERWVGTFGRALGWSVIVIVAPWACFMLISWVARMRSNAAGAALVFGITLIETLVLAWLFNFSVNGTIGWIFAIAGVLTAGVYNVFACDWIAERV